MTETFRIGEAGTEASNTIRFVLDGQVIHIENPEPTRTVLNFLREDLGRTGTKEGCAEGDCGACTVVLAELQNHDGELSVRAVNSCIQFLSSLDGKELITVESLAKDGRSLHPVQRAMVDCHGSQCGFCTPGFVMSLFALYKAPASVDDLPGRHAIDDALAGNLCRCTGYRPIIDAAERMFASESSASARSGWLMTRGPSGDDIGERIRRLKSIQRTHFFRGGPDAQQFISPTCLDEFFACLAENPGATLLAGGTDVGLWVTKQHRDLGSVIYLGAVAELQRLDVSTSHLDIGAAVSLAAALPELLKHFPELKELFFRFASPPIRNAGTLGGNIANGSPIGDSMPALIVLGTTLWLRSSEGRREVTLESFYKDYMVNDLRPGEILESIRIPLKPAGAVLRSYKISKRFDQDISAVCAALMLRIDKAAVTDARIAFGGMAATVKRATRCEQAMLGQRWNEATVCDAMQALEQDFEPLDDMRASAGYRMRVAQNLLRRFYLETDGRLANTVYEYGRAG